MQIFRLTSGMTTADGLRKTKHMAPLACDTGDREHGKGQPIERLSAPFSVAARPGAAEVGRAPRFTQDAKVRVYLEMPK